MFDARAQPAGFLLHKESSFKLGSKVSIKWELEKVSPGANDEIGVKGYF